MKNFPLLIISILFVVSCTKDKETISDNKTSDSLKLSSDSLQTPSITNADAAGVFQINPLAITSAKARSIFSKDGNPLFYFDQNSNKGNIRIDGKDYQLDEYDFNENTYSLSGNEVKIEATNGDFKDQSSDCVEGNFPEVKVTLNGKTLHLTNIAVKDCPDY